MTAAQIIHAGVAAWLVGIPVVVLGGAWLYCHYEDRREQREDTAPLPPLIELGPRQAAELRRQHTGRRLHGRERLTEASRRDLQHMWRGGHR